MIYRSMFPQSLFADMSRLQHDLAQLFDLDPSIRGTGLGGFPAMNVGSTPHSIEIYAFVPGIDPDSIDVMLERGVLTISGERHDSLNSQQENATVHIHERFSGRFRRVVSLPDEVDSEGVSAQYREGVLHVSVKRREETQPRRISIH